MRLVFSTAEFVYSGRLCPGFPIVLGADMRPLEPYHGFLKDRLLDHSVLSKETWEAYGRRIWDFAAFLGANGLDWKHEVGPMGEGPVIRYQRWALFEKRISKKTFNARVRLIVELYLWAKKSGQINRLPFSFKEIRYGITSPYLGYAANNDRTLRPEVVLREWQSEPEFLGPEQVHACRNTRMPPGTRLLFELMLRVGLRSCEARTFPVSYVFNPVVRRDCRPDKLIRVRLRAVDMHIKFGKDRDVDVPFPLMVEMHAFLINERNRLARISGDHNQAQLVLNSQGRAFTKGSCVDAFRSISSQAGFRCRALMLRHTYAIRTLAQLKSRPEFLGEPLLYVRDRLGHSSVETTAIYLKQLNQLSSAVVLALEEEFDRHFNV